MLVNTIMPEKEISCFEKTVYHEFMHTATVSSMSLYNQFLNWVSGEFILCLQDWETDLRIFFPGGWLSIDLLDNTQNKIEFRIQVKSKNKQKAVKTNNDICGLLSHLLKQKT